MLPPTNTNLDPQTRLLLALLSTLQQQPHPSSPPPPYKNTPTSSLFQLTTTTTDPNPGPTTADDDPNTDTEDSPPQSAPLKIHINATTTIHGNSNRIMLPSPSSTEENISNLVRVVVKDLLPPPSPSTDGEGEVKEPQQQIEVTLDAGTRIEGSGNVVVYRKGLAGAVVGREGRPREERWMGRGRRGLFRSRSTCSGSRMRRG